MPSFDPTDPLALLTALALAVAVLWRAHVSSDADVKAQRDLAVTGWREQTTATAQLAQAIDQRNSRDRAQVRSGDPT